MEKGFVRNARLQPASWPLCATQSGTKLRWSAFDKFRLEIVDEDTFHKVLQAKTKNLRAKQVIEVSVQTMI